MGDKSLDMSLDDLIKSSKNASRGRGRGAPRQNRGGRSSGSYGGRIIVGPGTRRVPQGPLRVNTRPSAFTIAKPFRRTTNFPWKQDLLEDSLAAAGKPRLESGTKLHLSNLDRRVSNDDIRELFSEIGELKRYAVHYDKRGVPSGSAEVVYSKRSDAFAAMKRYNNVKLDGRPIKIDISSPSSELPVSARINVISGMNGGPIRRVVTAQGGACSMAMAPIFRGPIQRARGGMSNIRGRGHVQRQAQGQGLGQTRGGGGGGGGGRGRGRGWGRRRGLGKKQPKEKSAVELDKELEKYHAEAMETS